MRPVEKAPEKAFWHDDWYYFITMKTKIGMHKRSLFPTVLLLLIMSTIFSCSGDSGSGENDSEQTGEDILISSTDTSNTRIEFMGDTIVTKQVDEGLSSLSARDLVPGTLAFKVPEEMRVGQRYDAFFRIIQQEGEAVLFEDIDSAGYTIKVIKVGSRMKATLYDPSNGRNFEITTRSSEEQKVSAASVTVWRWHIQPLRKGTHTLIAKVSVKVFDEVGEAYRDIPVYEGEITVTGSPGYTFSTFFSKHWQWLFGTLFIPLFIWLYKKRKKTA